MNTKMNSSVSWESVFDNNERVSVVTFVDKETNMNMLQIDYLRSNVVIPYTEARKLIQSLKLIFNELEYPAGQ